MFFDLDILLFISSILILFFTIFTLLNNFDNKDFFFDKIDIFKKKINYAKYMDLNNLYVIHYDTYNKTRIWIFTVEF
ncbi:hypothetical protein [Dethiothermospora halolimnae]|uniref:hypothetical protein n=1 Tax=Dethiothermospora halolimnae TaxID=3114390 RepID=UPI003CCBDF8F